jgi:putative flippase GtrA
VGASSFAVGFIIFNSVYFTTGRLIFSATFSYVLSLINGFVWNRRWTFHDKRGEPRWQQAIKFTVVNATGYCLNIAVSVLLLSLISTLGQGAWRANHFRGVVFAILQGHAPHYSFLAVNGAGVVATAVVVLWNYLANHHWSFRK